MGARLKFWRRSHVPKRGSRNEAAASPLVTAPPSNFTRLHYNGSVAKSHSTTTQYRQLRRLWCYTRRFAMTICSATQRCNIVATLFRMVTTLFQHCNAVLYLKSSLRIVPCNIGLYTDDPLRLASINPPRFLLFITRIRGTLKRK